MTTAKDDELEPLTGPGGNVAPKTTTKRSRLHGESVIATSTAGSLHRTVHTLNQSSSPKDRDEADVFLRRVWGLLVLQYLVVLLIASPFVLINSFQHLVEPVHNVLELVAIAGIIACLCLAVAKGPHWPYAHLALLFLTCFVGLEFGLTFSEHSWGDKGLIALGQATTNFAVILSLLQFSLAWLTYLVAAFICLILSGLWMLVLYMAGTTWIVAISVGFGGWAFVLLVLFCCYEVSKEVAPEEYILAVLFILAPEALICLASKDRHPKESEEKEEVNEKDDMNYGGAIRDVSEDQP